jgi:hypothetical protein
VVEVVWFGAGFLIGMAVWKPFLVAAQVESRLVRFVAATDVPSVQGPARNYPPER